jgi:aminopeptidase N
MLEPLTTFSDRYASNTVYGISAYSSGSIFLSQLAYVIGQDNLDRTLLKYYDDFKFKHPTPNDFKRVAEKVSGLQLEWYLNAWTRTTKQIDYAVKSIEKNTIILENKGSMPMPIDLLVEFEDGSSENFNIPLQMMYGNKPTQDTILTSWSWVEPTYKIETGKPVKKVTIDPKSMMADTNRSNNKMSL